MLLIVMFWTIAAYDEGKSQRQLRWYTDGGATQTITNLSPYNKTTDEKLLPSDDEPFARWIAGPSSRLIFFSDTFWSSSYATFATAPREAAYTDVRVAQETFFPWAEPGTAVNVLLREPCRGEDMCTRWSSVKSVDLGLCSLHLPYGKNSIVSPTIASLAGKIYLADELLEGLISQVREYEKGKVAWSMGARVKVALKPDISKSRWFVAHNGEDLCLNTHAKLSHTATLISWLFFLPASGKCDREPYMFEVCGHIGMDSANHVKWTTTSLRGGWGGDGTDTAPKGCKQAVADGVLTAIEESVTEPIGASEPNAITTALQKQLEKSFAISAQSIIDEVTDDSEKKYGDSDESSLELELVKRYISSTCTNPGSWPGNPTSECFRGGMFSSIAGRCVNAWEVPAKNIKELLNNLFIALRNRGLCYAESPLERIERTPSGLELVVADYPQGRSTSWIWNLNRSLGPLAQSVPILGWMYNNECNVLRATEGEIDKESRFWDRGVRALLEPALNYKTGFQIQLGDPVEVKGK